eukprot:753099-Hanusia_phi.AAC.1
MVVVVVVMMMMMMMMMMMRRRRSEGFWEGELMRGESEYVKQGGVAKEVVYVGGQQGGAEEEQERYRVLQDNTSSARTVEGPDAQELKNLCGR